MTKQAEYRCAKCKHWWHIPIYLNGTNPNNGCPVCGHIYAEWINYVKDFERPNEPL